ncbi:MAG TPA: gliding motility-associated C-terminal domain-containing protein [Flavobacteriales bacterium]|nr:gliding motility-associated C-terminal domain-containing protein [Flavobacteriales bacterium]
MKRILRFALILLALNGYSQVQTNWWYFGSGKGLEFYSTGSPIAEPSGSTATTEGTASVADEVTGELLFYTDGKTVWNKLHNPMPNGTGLMGNLSSTQAAIIVSDPGNPNKYYIFHTDDMVHSGANGMRYTVVNMTLAGGLGDVVVAQKNILLFAPCSEQLSAVRHDNCTDWWVMGKGYNNNVYHCYQVSATGVGPAVTTTIGASVGTSSWGQSKFSPDGTRYCISTSGISQLYNFNNATGVISSPLSMVVFAGDTYGVSFSCDSKKLYIYQGSSASRLYQYDLTSGVPATILASATFIATTSIYNSLQLGRDFKIYIANSGGTPLSLINSPNTAGIGCGYTPAAVMPGGPSGSGNYGLPNFPDSYFNCISPCVFPLETSPNSINVTCAGENNGMAWVSVAYGLPPYTYSWTTGSTNDSIFNLGPGSYTVTVTDYLGEVVTETITITSPGAVSVNATVSADSVCAGLPVTFTAIGAGGTGSLAYQWSTGAGDTSPTNTETLSSSGYTYVTVTDDNGCEATDSVFVTVLAVPAISSSPDTCICSGASATITASGTPTFSWNSGQTTASITVSPTVDFLYIVSYSNGACTVSDSTFICVYPSPSVSITSPDTICTGMSATFTANVVSGTAPLTYAWSGIVAGAGSSVTTTPATGGTETVNIDDANGCSTSATVSLVIVPVPDIVILSPNDTCICDGTPITLTATGTPAYNWSNGYIDPAITVSPSSNTTYVVTYFNGGCSDSDSVTICVNPSPIVIASADTTIKLEDTAVISVTGTGPFTWTPSNTLSCDTCTVTVASPVESTTYYVSATNAFGCTTTDEVVVYVVVEILIPNIITPDGDGLNDNFRIVGLPPGSVVSIFNRWGNLLHESSSYENNWSTKSPGVYYYAVTLPSGQQFKGFFHVAIN